MSGIHFASAKQSQNKRETGFEAAEEGEKVRKKSTAHDVGDDMLRIHMNRGRGWELSLALLTQQGNHFVGGNDSLQALLIVDNRQRVEVVFIHDLGDLVLLVSLAHKD